MRIAISAPWAIAASLFAAAAGAQGDRPEPLPVLPTMPGVAPPKPVVSSAAPTPPPSSTPAPTSPPPIVTPPPASPTPPSAPPPKPPPASSTSPAPAPKKKPAAPSDAPPDPPPPGLAPPPPAPAPPPVFANDSGARSLKDPPVAGWNDGFFLRDPGDYFRFYPRGRIHLDFHSFPGAPTGTAAEGGVEMLPRFFARRLRLELSGQALQRWTFTFGVDFGGQSLSSADGRSGVLVDNPNENTTGAVGSAAIIADAFINYALCPCLNILVGQQQAPFSLENRTDNNVHTFMERNLPMRSFVAPNAKELGLTLWGDLLDNRLSYEMGVYAGDGQNRPQIDGYPDFIGRVFTRPLLGGKGALEKLQLGGSVRVGQRDPGFVGYDYQPITTGQGFTLWEPRYRDSAGDTVHVIPSGLQTQLGGELRVPVSIFEVRGEGYYVSNDTREAKDGTQLTNTERFGRMSGAGWYVQLSAWPWGDAFVNGDPGFWRPYVVDPAREAQRPQKGLEVVALVGGVNADYKGASRGGTADSNTASAQTGSAIDVYQYGFAINYWYTRFVHASVNYNVYHTPGSGSPDNRAVVPGNLHPEPSANEHVLHELGTRLAIGF